MKAIIAVVLIALNGFGQSHAEVDVLKSSAQIFRWEVENKIDAIEYLFSDKLKVVTSPGDIQCKEQYHAT